MLALSGNASGAGPAGKGLPWGEDEGCLAGLSSGGWWSPSDTPDAMSLGCDQDGGGRPRLAPEVPIVYSSAGDGTGGMLPASADLGAACPG